jgi:hypothetical protein
VVPGQQGRWQSSLHFPNEESVGYCSMDAENNLGEASSGCFPLALLSERQLLKDFLNLDYQEPPVLCLAGLPLRHYLLEGSEQVRFVEEDIPQRLKPD